MRVQSLKAEQRDTRGTRRTRVLRKAGRVPGIVYGHEKDPLSISVDRHELELLLARGSHVVTLDLGSNAESCLLRDVQYDYLGIAPTHLDLARIDLNEKVQVKVPLELRGKAPGLSEGGAIEQQLIDLEIECQAINIPDSIRIQLANLHVNGAIHVSEITLPDGVRAIPAGDTIVVACREVTLHVEVEEPAEGEVASAEPEIIAKGKETEEEESKD